MNGVKTVIDIQIRFADVDILGHVNNVNLQHYFDLGKTDYFKKVLGIGLVSMDSGLITASTKTDYFNQTRPDENITVETTVSKVGNKSITVAQKLFNKDNEEVKAVSETVLVVFDFKSQESFPVPDEWRIKME